jgi:hypothetical protein
VRVSPDKTELNQNKISDNPRRPRSKAFTLESKMHL